MSARPIETRTLRLLGICAFASMASMRVCDAMLASLATEFSATMGQVARTISGFALAYGVLQLFYGPLGDRYGKLRIIGFATLACTIGSAAAAISPTLEWLVASRILSGVAAAGIIPLTMAWIGDSVAYEGRQEVLARLLGATVFGMICGQWLGGLIADLAGWRAAFILLAVLFLVGGAMLAKRARAWAPPLRSGSVSACCRMSSVLASPWARVVLLVACIEGALAFSALAFIPSHLQARFGLSMSMAGAIVALYGIGGLLYSRCASMLVQRLGESGLARTGGACLGIAFATIASARAWQWALPACLLAGFGFYALHNTLQTHATQMAPAVRGTAVSLFSCALFFGQSLGVLAAAWIVDTRSSSMVFALSAAGLPLLGAAFASLVGRRQRQAREA
ncbi:MFS transporter [Variovorax saccharolyticus]|uniref:MFS transporter n=1 Tax=Variovorax saccharolyticus TaxID=3053516 RepID=UPI002577AFB3|nr:MFS transporter [Variovorax sp. J22R187]MDM0020847.1 MFS transporter [Variovorax sp. J22R187]